MTVYHSFPDYYSLLSILNDQYKTDIKEIYLYRDMIGSVYFASNDTARYVFKLFRTFDDQQALQSVSVIQYLKENDYPVVPIVLTAGGEPYITLDMPEGKRIGVLFDYVEGQTPSVETDAKRMGLQVAKLHNIMTGYPRPLIRRGKEFFIDRYITTMKQNHYCPAKVNDLEEYGVELWHRMDKLPSGFCHGDLHSGNMKKTDSGDFTLFDFDIVSDAPMVIDVAVISNKTGFNRLDDSAFDSTREVFERFYEGYGQQRTLSDEEALAVFSFIAIRHYELIGTMDKYRLHLEGRHWLSQALFDQQYEWLMKWRSICAVKGML